MKVAEQIVEQILSRPPIRLDMIDLRMFDDYTYRHSVNVAVNEYSHCAQFRV